MSYTPGPWTVEVSNEYVGTYRIKESGAAPYDEVESQREDEANARLIAAAPDMYAELEKLEHACARCRCQQQYHSETLGRCWTCEECWEYDPPVGILAALAKARGEA